MPDWRVVRKQPIYSIRASLGRWKKVKRKRIAAGGQTAITGFFRAAPRAAPRAQHAHGGGPVTAHDDDDGATTAAATAADSAATTIVESRKRQLTMEGFSKRKRVVSPTLTDPQQVNQEADAETDERVDGSATSTAPEATDPTRTPTRGSKAVDPAAHHLRSPTAHATAQSATAAARRRNGRRDVRYRRRSYGNRSGELNATAHSEPPRSTPTSAASTTAHGRRRRNDTTGGRSTSDHPAQAAAPERQRQLAASASARRPLSPPPPPPPPGQPGSPPPPPAGNPHPGLTLDTLHRAPVGQGLLPPRPARAFGFWSLRALAKARRGRVYV